MGMIAARSMSRVDSEWLQEALIRQPSCIAHAADNEQYTECADEDGEDCLAARFYPIVQPQHHGYRFLRHCEIAHEWDLSNSKRYDGEHDGRADLRGGSCSRRQNRDDRRQVLHGWR